jgi:DnaK suppressor protein
LRVVLVHVTGAGGAIFRLYLERLTMANLTDEQLAHLKQLLDQRERELRDELHREMSERDEYIDVKPTLPDPADSSFASLAADLGHAAATRDLTELRAVEGAQQRMENGEYGDCVSCGTEIPYERLEVQPAAARCAPCQEMYEKTHGDAGRGATM